MKNLSVIQYSHILLSFLLFTGCDPCCYKPCGEEVVLHQPTDVDYKLINDLGENLTLYRLVTLNDPCSDQTIIGTLNPKEYKWLHVAKGDSVWIKYRTITDSCPDSRTVIVSTPFLGQV